MKKVNWNLIFRAGIWSVLVIAFLVSLGFSSRRQKSMLCKEVRVVMLDTNGQTFVTPDDVHEMIRNKFGFLEGKPMSSINISLLEKSIDSNPFISGAEVFSSIDGKITIDVKQRNPVLRIVNFNDESFYIDDEGVFMPLSEKYAARVPVANGFIFDRFSEGKVVKYSNDKSGDSTLHMIDRIFHVAEYLQKDDFWKAAVEQIYVNADGDLELVPRIGGHTVVLGSDEKLGDKLDKLFLFYRESQNIPNWNSFKTINIKYKDQVVCSKN